MDNYEFHQKKYMKYCDKMDNKDEFETNKKKDDISINLTLLVSF